VALSPDGRSIAFISERNGTTQVFVHRLGEMTTESVPNTHHARSVFFSPDGGSLGFYVTDGSRSHTGSLKKISLPNGAPVTLHEGTVVGANWELDGSILFGSYAGVSKIASSGGEATQVAIVDGAFYSSPQLLPGGSALLLTIDRAGRTDIAVLPEAGREAKVLAEGAQARYLHTGHILFYRETSLWALPFDAERLQATGDAVPVLSNLGDDRPSPFFSADRNGNLVYIPESATPSRDGLFVWVDLHRNFIYRLCGYTMCLCIVLIAVYKLFIDSHGYPVETIQPVFWLESLAIVVFAISWLTKGGIFLKD